MEEQDSICLQKKMILILSIIIFAFMGTIMYMKREKELVKVATLSDFKENLITVERNDDIELIEQVAYTASESIELNENTEEIEPKEEEIIEENKKTERPIEVASRSTTRSTVRTAEVNQETNVVNHVSYKALAENNPPQEGEYSNVFEATATAYCLCKKCCGKNPWDKWYGYTASGLKIEPGTGVKVIAVDPKIVPLGTEVYVEGLNGAWDYGHAVAADTGSAIKNIKIDLYMDSHQETLEWGVKKVNVYVLNHE